MASSPLRLFADRAGSSLAGGINNTNVSINLVAGGGALFPSPVNNQFFAATLIDAATGLLFEIVHCTARTGDNLTIVRGQESTVALTWNAGDLFQKLLTSGDMSSMVQQNQLLVPVYNYYQNFSTGNDAYSGTSPTVVPFTSNPVIGPFQTIGGAINFIALYLSVSQVNLYCADYVSGPQAPFLVPPSFIGAWSIIGNNTTPANVTIQNTGTSNFGQAMQIQGGVTAVVSGMRFMSAFAANISNFGAQLFLNNSWLTGNGYGGLACVTGVCNVIGTLTYSGSGAGYIFLSNNTGGKLSFGYGGGSLVTQTALAITILQTAGVYPTVLAFCSANDCALIYLSNPDVTLTGSLHTPSLSYTVNGNGVIEKQQPAVTWHIPGSGNSTTNGGVFYGTV